MHPERELGARMCWLKCLLTRRLRFYSSIHSCPTMRREACWNRLARMRQLTLRRQGAGRARIVLLNLRLAIFCLQCSISSLGVLPMSWRSLTWSHREGMYSCCSRQSTSMALEVIRLWSQFVYFSGHVVIAVTQAGFSRIPAAGHY